LPNLTEAEEVTYQELVDSEHQRLKPEQEPKRRKYAQKRAKETGEKVETIYKRLVEADLGRILASTVLRLKSGGRMSIAQMVATGKHGEYIEDPTEATGTWARLYIDGPEDAFVRSFIHGWGTLKVIFDVPGTPVVPHYPPQVISLQEARRVVHSAFVTWAESLPAYWHEKALYESELDAQAGYAA
jgi:hypothetical protein